MIKQDKEEQKKYRGSVFVAESAYNSENTQKIRDQLNGSRNIQGFALRRAVLFTYDFVVSSV